MIEFKTHGFALLAVLCLAEATASAQTNFPEVEPNSTKAEATPVACMRAGDFLTGTTTGTSLTTGSTLVSTADTFRIQTCALPICIYRHRLVITTTGTPGYQGTIRGLSQIGGVIQQNTDIQMQTTLTTTLGIYNQWYGFGKGEEIYYRISGTGATTSPYAVTMETVPETPVAVPGVFAPGTVTITTENQGHQTDTDLWVYDSNLNAIPFFGNDDTPITLPGGGVNFESTLQATFAPGTYFLALTNYQFGNDQPAAPNDFQTGNVVDFPDAAVNGPEFPAVPLAMDFQITDGVTSSSVPVLKTEPLAIHWFQFTVGAPTPPVGYCFGDSGNCPCGSVGAAGNGCPHSANPAGGHLAGAGSASVSSDSFALTGSGMPNSSALYFQGTTRINNGAGVVFGDGLRCTGGAVTRLGIKINAAGTSTYPIGADVPISVKGAITAGGCIRTYQCWFRNAAPFCNPETFNLTNGLSGDVAAVGSRGESRRAA